jgi:hypothetical protein
MQFGLNWQFHKPTTTKGKLPNDWEKQGHIMVLWIIYSVRVSNLLLALLLTLIKQEYTLCLWLDKALGKKKGQRMLVCLVVMTRGPSLHVFLDL